MSNPSGSFSFHMPTAIEFGCGSLNRLGKIVTRLGGRHPLLISDPGVARTGLVQRTADMLSDAGLRTETFTDIQSDPSAQSVSQAVALARQTDRDIVIGMGGGSALDVAKAVGLMMTNPGTIFDYVGIDKVQRAAAPVIAVPTTAGTGSELTIWSVLTDTEHHTKISIGSVLNYPRVALLDPEVTLSLPSAITAQTGMDALTHAIESYVNTASHAVSQAHAEKAIALIGRSLRRASAHGTHLDARSDMMLASTLAGIAFNATRLGYVHAFGLPLGSRYKISHGLVNAIMLPVVMQFNLPGNLPAYARIAAMLGENVAGLTERAAAQRSVVAVRQLNADIGITQTLADFGAKETDFETLIDEALQSGNCVVNPRQANRAQMRAMLAAGCSGTPLGD